MDNKDDECKIRLRDVVVAFIPVMTIIAVVVVSAVIVRYCVAPGQ